MSDYERNEVVRVEGVQRILQTERGIKVKFPGERDGEGQWLPLSVVEDTDLTSDGQVGWIEMPYWLAEDRDLEGAIDAGQDAGSSPAADVSSSPETSSATPSSSSAPASASAEIGSSSPANASSNDARDGGSVSVDADAPLPL